MKTRMTLLLSLLIVFAFLPNVIADKIEISLKDRVVLENDEITIKDISTVTGDDANLVNRIEGIAIGNAPGANIERRINLGFIIMRLNSANVEKFLPDSVRLF